MQYFRSLLMIVSFFAGHAYSAHCAQSYKAYYDQIQQFAEDRADYKQVTDNNFLVQQGSLNSVIHACGLPLISSSVSNTPGLLTKECVAQYSRWAKLLLKPEHLHDDVSVDHYIRTLNDPYQQFLNACRQKA